MKEYTNSLQLAKANVTHMYALNGIVQSQGQGESNIIVYSTHHINNIGAWSCQSPLTMNEKHSNFWNLLVENLIVKPDGRSI